ncbi:unnamed protein product, partial [Polarella glacialis]
VSRERVEALAARNKCADRLSILQLGKEASLNELGGDALLNSFDIVTLEPPPLAPTYGRLEEGMRQYTAWAQLAASVTRQGGLLVVACRDRTITPVKLLRCLNMGVWAAGRKASLVHRSACAGFDFPVHLALQDTNQLQVIALRVL